VVLLALLEPVALAVHLQDVDVVGETIEHGPGEALGAEDLGPLIERQVAGDDDRPAIVALAEHLEEQLGSGFRKRDEAQLVDDQELACCKLFLQALQISFVPGLEQFMDQCRGGGEADRQAPLAGSEAKSECDVRLTSTAVAKCNHIFMALDVLAADKFLDQGLVEGRDRGEVEGVEALDRWELGRPDPPLNGPAFTIYQFQLCKPQEEAGMVDPSCALSSNPVVLPQEGRQLEHLEVVLEQHLWGVAHILAPVIRPMYSTADVVSTRARGR